MGWESNREIDFGFGFVHVLCVQAKLCAMIPLWLGSAKLVFLLLLLAGGRPGTSRGTSRGTSGGTRAARDVARYVARDVARDMLRGTSRGTSCGTSRGTLRVASRGQFCVKNILRRADVIPM